MDKDEQDIRHIINTWIKATASGDTAKVLSLMSDDVVFLVAGHPPMRGKAAFAEASTGMENMKIEGQSEIQEIRIMGDFAYAWTNLSVSVTQKSGDKMKRSGNTLSIFQKQSDGTWVLTRDANMLTTDTSPAS
jgi:uncharacterized protein (TIGR02246 family)